MSALYAEIYALVKLIPKGRVMSYGGVARQLGHPAYSRVVGYALNALGPRSAVRNVPWWRVINSQGRISNSSTFDAADRQRELLRAEGIEVGDDYRLNLRDYDAETLVYAKLQKGSDNRVPLHFFRDV